MQTKNRSSAFWLFMLGMFSLTQVNIGGYLAISEILCLLIGPIMFFRDISVFKRDGIMPVFWLLFLWLCGAVFVDLKVHSSLPAMLRGIAVPIVIIVNLASMYKPLRNDPMNIKWFAIGSFISSIVSVFVFQAGSDVGAAENQGLSAMEATLGYKLFWQTRISTLLSLPMTCWYLSFPFGLLILLKLASTGFALFSGGRSAFATSAVAFGLLFIGRQNPQKMKSIRKHLMLLVLIFVPLLLLIKAGYGYAARNDWLGYEEEAKYYLQSQGGKGGVLSMLMSGRSEFFIGLIAALDKPIIGHGSHALDTGGYRERFLAKYGNMEDLYKYEMALRRAAAEGVTSPHIPAHSHIITFWMWHGIFALIFWLYLLWIAGETLIKRLGVYPPYFGYLVCGLPALFWAVLFSPFGGRMSVSFTLCSMLLIRAMDHGVVGRDYYLKGIHIQQ